MKDDPGAAAVFHAGLRSRDRLEIPSVLDAYDFSMAGKTVDVGGGTGALLSAILSRYENAKGVLFDAGPVSARLVAGLSLPSRNANWLEEISFRPFRRG